MSLTQLKKDFCEGKMTKQDYIDRMHDIHKILFQYPSFISSTDIQEVRISDQGVIMVTREMGIQLLCDQHDKRLLPIETLNFNKYEPAEMNAILGLLKMNCPTGCRFLDIGANIGWYSINVAKEIPGAIISAFEPIPKTFAYLQKNVEMNKTSTIQCHNFGFSNKNSEIEFFYYKEGSGNASMQNVTGMDSAERVVCQVVRLDDYAEENKIQADFIKCDTEGAELFVFQGAREFIGKQRPIIFTEMLRKWSKPFGYHPNDIIDFFDGLGYRPYVISNGKLKEFGRVTEETQETNYFFLDQKKHRL